MKNKLHKTALWMMILAGILFGVSFCFGQTNNPIHHGLLQDNLNANGQAITNVGSIAGNGNGLTNLTTLGTNFCLVSKLGNDSTGLRNGLMNPFLTIGEAKTNAQSGDTIYVLPGVYAENNLLKLGVAYQFWPGVTISNNPTGNNTNGWGIFDDRAPGAGQGTYYIYGYPNLWYSTGTISNAFTVDTQSFFHANWDAAGTYDGDIWSFGSSNEMGPIVITNGSSVIARLGDIYFQNYCLDLTSVLASTIALANNSYSDITFGRIINPIGVVAVTNFYDNQGGVMYVLTPYTNSNGYGWAQSGAQGIVWQTGQGTNTGEAHVRGNFLDVFPSYGLWCNGTGIGTISQESQFFFDCDLSLGSIYLSGPTNAYGTNMVMWMNVPHENSISSQGAVQGEGLWKLYYSGQKVQNTNGACFEVSGSAWITVQKASSGTSSGHWVVGNSQGNDAFEPYLSVSIQHYEDLGGLTQGIVNQGSEMHLLGGQLNIQNGNAVFHKGGTTYIDGGMRIDTSAGVATNDWPIYTISSGLKLGSCELTNNTSHTVYSIFATNAQTVVVDGAAIAWSPPFTNITISSPGNSLYNYTPTATVAVTGTGLTNTTGGNLQACIISMSVTYKVYNGSGTPVFTNTSFTGTDTFILPPGGSITAASGLSGNAYSIK